MVMLVHAVAVPHVDCAIGVWNVFSYSGGRECPVATMQEWHQPVT